MGRHAAPGPAKRNRQGAAAGRRHHRTAADTRWLEGDRGPRWPHPSLGRYGLRSAHHRERRRGADAGLRSPLQVFRACHRTLEDPGTPRQPLPRGVALSRQEGHYRHDGYRKRGGVLPPLRRSRVQPHPQHQDRRDRQRRDAAGKSDTCRRRERLHVESQYLLALRRARRRDVYPVRIAHAHPRRAVRPCLDHPSHRHADAEGIADLHPGKDTPGAGTLEVRRAVEAHRDGRERRACRSPARLRRRRGTASGSSTE